MRWVILALMALAAASLFAVWLNLGNEEPDKWEEINPPDEEQKT